MGSTKKVAFPSLDQTADPGVFRQSPFLTREQTEPVQQQLRCSTHDTWMPRIRNGRTTSRKQIRNDAHGGAVERIHPQRGQGADHWATTRRKRVGAESWGTSKTTCVPEATTALPRSTQEPSLSEVRVWSR